MTKLHIFLISTLTIIGVWIYIALGFASAPSEPILETPKPPSHRGRVYELRYPSTHPLQEPISPAIELTAAILILEAGGETEPEAMAAVLEVIRNRALSRQQTLTQVLTAPNQFCPLRDQTPEQAIIRAKAHPKWDTALTLARNKLNTDYTRGANHYHNTRVQPNWAKPTAVTTQIGGHIFYQL